MVAHSASLPHGAPLAAARPGIAVVSISRLQSLCEAVAPRYQHSARIFPLREGYGAAVTALEAHLEGGTVDVVIAAGSNGAYLRDHLPVPVVTVKVNGFDIMQAIAQASAAHPGQPIGLVLHDAISSEIDELRAWLNVDILQRAYRSVDEVRGAVNDLAARNCAAIIGPGMACDFAERAGIESVFLYSLGAVDEAFSHAVELARVSRDKESKRVRLNTIVAHLRDGVAAFDDSGRLEAVNPAMLSLLGLSDPAQAELALTARIGRFLRDGGTRGTPIEDSIEHIDGRALSITCMPITEHGARTGAVLTVQDALVAQRIDRTLRTSQRPRNLVARHRLGDLVGASAAMDKVRRLALTGAVHDATVLLTGESGTGKELVAQGIHSASRRRGNPFVAFNCAALPEGLIESELFGHEEGAFTGARRGGKPGLFETAHTGTIFLDEIGEMPASLQSRLLRVLQERYVVKLGATQATPVDVRVIAATHRDLKALVAQGSFRADLYYRLNVLNIHLPPLRDRRDDVREIASHLLGELVAEYAPAADANPQPQTELRAGVMTMLEPLFASYGFPGNVRELGNLLTRAAIHHAELKNGSRDDLLAVFPELLDAERDARREYERERGEGSAAGYGAGDDADVRRFGAGDAPVTFDDVQRALAQSNGNRSGAAKRLGISRTTLWRLLKTNRDGSTSTGA
ncbi:propionate catabolism operon regulatory protein PrpR [Paraburkholderia sp.]|uniref:propionate catabolism operon regulatory protein PrpR n=1 Tax=Paraburkholderia sp. TaxID=1926495 RepID=UPI0023892978|nr:propionate catabolism operon regulatory protein PrpR [Paraburkholderia sp.]MDE1184235.1 propionate catabolism operon regulatory protein PrpR [Paraburkholderia sp.]